VLPDPLYQTLISSLIIPTSPYHLLLALPIIATWQWLRTVKPTAKGLQV
jgi:hypothetical protein